MWVFTPLSLLPSQISGIYFNMLLDIVTELLSEKKKKKNTTFKYRTTPQEISCFSK